MWYGRYPWGHFLAPLGILYAAASTIRRYLYRLRLASSVQMSAPVIVIGNIAIGGTGKTPLTIWLANYLKRNGFAPGVICSGYGGAARHWPQQVRGDSDPVAVGDEAVLIARQTGCPVAAGRDRVASARALLTYQRCDVLLSDDGLQHYHLARDFEVAVVDGMRRHGTGWCFPAGPLREPRGRLADVDLIVTNGVARLGELGMSLQTEDLRALADEEERRSARAFKGQDVHGVAGIGNPRRFFEQLRNLGLRVLPHAFPDHHKFTPVDLRFGDMLPIIMTEKDAVKCRAFAPDNAWYLPVVAAPESSFGERIISRLNEFERTAGAEMQTRR